MHVCNHCCDLCTSQEAQDRLVASGIPLLVPSTETGATGRGQKRAADNEAGSAKKKRSSKKPPPK